MPKILVAPGSGDIHWVMLKLESFIKSRFAEGAGKPEVWVWCEADSTKRSEDYVRRIPFVTFGGYFDGKPHQAFGSQVFIRGKPWCVKNWEGFDYFVAFNAPLGEGKSLESLWPECDVNWNYPLELTDADRKYGLDFLLEHGAYVPVSFFGHSFYKKWLNDFSVPQIRKLLNAISDRGLKVVLTGAKWDIPWMRNLHSAEYINLVGETTMGQLLGLMRQGEAFVGFAAGNGMLAQHLGTKTFMLWHPRQWTPAFMTNWVEPKKNDTVYHALDIRHPCTPYILENL